jgi:hypothetical protein
VTTPRSKELDQDVLLLVTQDLVPLVGNKVEDRSVVGGRNSLRLDTRLNLSSGESLDKLLDRSLTNSLGQWELGTFGQILNYESGPRVSGEVQGFTVFDELDGVDVDERNFTLVLLGQRSQFLYELITVGSVHGVGK